MSDFIIANTSASNSNLIFLIDTEASVSLIKISSISRNIEYNKNDIIKLIGIAKNPILSLGSFDLKITEQNVEFIHKFHIVSDDFLIPSNGIVGKDFIKRFKCLVDYGDMTLTIRKTNSQPVIIPIKSEILEGVSALPPRSETFKVFHIKSEQFPCIVEAQEVEEGVLVPTTLVHEPESWLRVLNIKEDFKIIDTNKIKTSPLNDFRIVKPEKNDTNSIQRLMKLRDTIKKRVPEFMRNKLTDLCMGYSDIFYVEGDKPTVNNFYEHKLVLKDNEPVYTRNHRLPHYQKVEINRQVKELLANDLIELSKSPYSSPVLIVPKKSTDGKPKYRMCIDYKKLNKKLIPDMFPLPRMDDILESLGRAKFFSIMDLYSGYHQVPLTKESRPMTAFATDSGLFQWKVLPFGLSVAPASFTRMMTIAFSGLTHQQAFIYMDDLIVIGISENQHLNNLKSVFEMCRKNNLKLNPEKCEFFKSEVTFLGHNCTSEGLKPDSKKLAAVREYPRSTNKDEVRRFVAFANYYRRFIRNFSTITCVLTRLLRKRIKFEWSISCENAFRKIQTKLMSTPILSYPDFTKEFKVTVDASQLGCGAVISQDHNGEDKPIAFISRTFKKGEKNKAIIEKELLAIHFPLKTFRHYLYGQKFVVYSDHMPLIYLFKMQNPTSKLMRIKMDLEEFDFTIQHIKGKENVVADALSRISIKDLHEMYEENHIFKIQIAQFKNTKCKTENPKIKNRNENSILAFTRSMARTKNTNTAENHDSQLDCIDNNRAQTVYENIIQTKKNPRVRLTYYKADKDGCTKNITLCAYRSHKKIFEIKLGLDNEKVTLNVLLS